MRCDEPDRCSRPDGREQNDQQAEYQGVREQHERRAVRSTSPAGLGLHADMTIGLQHGEVNLPDTGTAGSTQRGV